MSLLREILDRVVLVGAVLAAGCVPSFIAQYRQRIGGMLDQAQRDLAPFEEIARRYHGGDINKLIKHHLASTDGTFRSEGQAIQAMVDAVARLREAATALQSDLWGQAAWLARHGDADVARATWEAFVPAMSFTGVSLLLTFAAGVGTWLVFLAVWFGVSRFMDIVLARGRPGVYKIPRESRKERAAR